MEWLEQAIAAEAERRAQLITSRLFRAGCALPIGSADLPDLARWFDGEAVVIQEQRARLRAEVRAWLDGEATAPRD